MSDYKHGVYGETGSASNVIDATQVTTPIYIGTLPTHRIDANALASIKSYSQNDCAMYLLTSIKDVKKLNLISDDWEAYSLCEAVDVHFLKDSAIAPIILVAPTASEKETESKSAEVSLTKSGTSYIGYLNDARAIITDMAITVSGVQFEDGEITYAYDGDRIKIVITRPNFNINKANVTYSRVKCELMSTTEFENCLTLIDKVEGVTNRIPNILCAPQYSEVPQYHDLMLQKAIEKLSGKWHIIPAVDIANGESNETALAWKNTNSYNHKLEKVFYHKLGFEGKKYHMSVVWTATVQRIDAENDNIPCESASNKAVFATSIEGETGAVYVTEEDANALNQKGITTAIATKGQIRLWGSHMGNYDFDNLSSIPVEDRFDIAIRMSAYLRNYLQYNYLDEVDENIDRKDIDSIINSVQMWLDSLVNEGRLLFGTVEFDADSDLANGDIVFNIHVTYPCMAKSITFKVIYTDKGLSVFTEKGVEE